MVRLLRRATSLVATVESGIFVQDVSASGNVISGNYVGTDVTGTLARPNAFWGIFVWSGINTTIGGSAAGSGNLIAGNQSGGISISRRNVGDVVTGNTIAGNTVGLNVGGTAALANQGDGVSLGTSVRNTTVDKNTISGNTGVGLRLSGTTSTTITGNTIGLNTAGNAAVANGSIGLMVSGGSSGTLIGGSAVVARNIISGNTNEVGIWVTDSTTTTKIQGNYIGLNSAGTAAIGNGRRGIDVNGVSNTTIGTDGDGTGDATKAMLSVVTANLAYGW